MPSCARARLVRKYVRAREGRQVYTMDNELFWIFPLRRKCVVQIIALVRVYESICVYVYDRIFNFMNNK